MKIVHLVPNFNLDQKYQEFYLAKYHARLGHDVFVVTTNKKIKEISKYRINNFTVICLPKKFGYSDFILAKHLKTTLKKINPDIVHAHDMTQGFQVQAAQYKKEIGYRFIIDQHRYSLDIRPSLLVRLEYLFFRRLVANFAYKRADYITAIVPEAKEFINKFHSYRGEISVIPLGFDPELFFPDEGLRKKMRLKYKVANDSFVIVCTGNMQEFKKIEILVEAFNAIINDNVHLFLVGNIKLSYKNVLCSLAQRGANIHFVPNQNDESLNEFYNMSDIAVWPFFPTVSIINALGSGLPVILPDTNVSKYYFQGTSGRMFKTGDVKSLRNIMQDLIVSKANLLELKNDLYTQVTQKYSYIELAKQYITIYNGLHS